jgi:hypothetical protein
MCAWPGAWCFYTGRWKIGAGILIIAGVLAHASLSFLLFGHWLCF